MHACRSLEAGDCDFALAGGLSLLFPSLSPPSFQEGMIDSCTGVLSPYDEKANGTVSTRFLFYFILFYFISFHFIFFSSLFFSFLSFHFILFCFILINLFVFFPRLPFFFF